MQITRPHIEVSEERHERATRAMALGATIADLAGKGFDLYPPLGRSDHADLCAIGKKGDLLVIECRAAQVTEGETEDTLYCYPRKTTVTIVAVVDHRDGTVFYEQPEPSSDTESR